MAILEGFGDPVEEINEEDMIKKYNNKEDN